MQITKTATGNSVQQVVARMRERRMRSHFMHWSHIVSYRSAQHGATVRVYSRHVKRAIIVRVVREWRIVACRTALIRHRENERLLRQMESDYERLQEKHVGMRKNEQEMEAKLKGAMAQIDDLKTSQTEAEKSVYILKMERDAAKRAAEAAVAASASKEGSISLSEFEDSIKALSAMCKHMMEELGRQFADWQHARRVPRRAAFHSSRNSSERATRYLLGKEEQPSGDERKELMVELAEVYHFAKQLAETDTDNGKPCQAIMEIDTSQLSSPDRRAIWDGLLQ